MRARNPASSTTLEALWSLFPHVAEFTKVALLEGFTAEQVDTFLDAPADAEREDDTDLSIDDLV